VGNKRRMLPLLLLPKTSMTYINICPANKKEKLLSWLLTSNPTEPLR
jgi:hypothetical protein